MKHPEEWFKDLNIYYLVASFKVTEYYALRCRHTKVTEEGVKEKNGWHAQVTTRTLKNIPFMSFAETEIFFNERYFLLKQLRSKIISSLFNEFRILKTLK